MRQSIKFALLVTAGIAAVATPVAAGHKMIRLRGMAPAHNYPAYHQAIDPVLAQYESSYAYVPSWQARRLQAPAFQQAYVDCAAPCGSYQGGQTVSYSVAQSGPTFVSRAMNTLGLRGLSSPGQVRYSKSAAHDFAHKRIAPGYNFGGSTVRTNALHSRDMLDWQENTTGKTLTLLANRANGQLVDNALYLGGAVQGAFMYQKTDVDGQFPLLSRFPFFSNNTDDEAGVFAINNAALSFTSTFGDWTTIYLQPEYSETEYAPDQDEFQLRKAYVVFGNLERSPFYAAFGRKTIDFGNFDSYNAFTQNEGQHYFWAVSDQPVLELGFYNNGWKFTGSAFSGGRQLRVAFADEDNNIGNYAFTAEKEFLLGKYGAFTVGGGYLHDTIYRDNFTSHTFQGRQNGTPPANLISGRNSAVNAFAEYNSPFFDAMVEYTTTLEPWAAAIPQTPDGVPFPQYLIDPLGSTTNYDNINFDQDLEVLVAQLRIKPMVNGRRIAIAASGSWGNISDDFGNPISGATFEDNQQHALSVEYPVNDYLDIGAEYVYNKGFIPFVAPQLVSNDETEAHAINIGFKARF